MNVGTTKLKTVYQLFSETVRACIAGDIFSQGAALSYYTIFAIAPLFIITLAIAGFYFGPDVARQQLFDQVDQLVGKEGGDAIESLVAVFSKSRVGFLATWIAVGTLFVAATGVFVQLQNSLNKLWNVRYTHGMGLRNFVRHRLLSFAMVFGIGFLLLVSLICSAGLAALGNFIGGHLLEKTLLLKALNFVISLVMITALFAMIFKFLPDVKIAWKDVGVGGFITAILFNFGKFLIGIYVGRSSVSSVYGVLGSLLIVLVWVYYSAQILLFGAQFTCIYAKRFGMKPQPLRGTEWVSSTTEPYAQPAPKGKSA